MQWYAIHEARLRRWNDVSYQDRWGIFGGQLVVPPLQKKPPFGVYNAGLNQFYFSTFHISKKTVNWYVEKINKFEPTHLFVYPSSLAFLSRLILDAHIEVKSPKVIITNAEPLLEVQRNVIQEAFNCPVRSSYGMAEIVAAASECKYGNTHYWPEVGFLEILDENYQPVKDGETGVIVSTGLINSDMPLISVLCW